MAPYGYLLLFMMCVAGGLTRWPLLALGAYFLSYYGHPPTRWWGPMLPDLRWSLTAAGVCLIAAIMYKPAIKLEKPWFKDTIVICMVLFVVWLWIQLGWALAPEDHIEGATFITKYLLIVYVIIKLLDTPEGLDFMCVSHIIGCAYLGLLAYQTGSGGDRLDGVGGPDLNDSNTMSMQMATAAMLGVVQVLTGPIWKRGIVVLCMPFILNAMILSQSRGSFLALFAGGIALFLLAPPGKKKIIGLLGAAGVVLFLMVASQSFWERMNTIKADEEGQRDLSAETRIVLAHAQLRMFLDHPMGSGHRGTAALSREYIDERYMAQNREVAREDRQRSSHNTFLSVLSEHGIPGTLIYGTLLFAGYRRVMSLRSVKDDDPVRSHISLLAAGIGGALVVIYVAGQTADYIRKEIIPWTFAMLVAASRVMEASRAAQKAKDVESNATDYSIPFAKRVQRRVDSV